MFLDELYVAVISIISGNSLSGTSVDIIVVLMHNWLDIEVMDRSEFLTVSIITS